MFAMRGAALLALLSLLSSGVAHPARSRRKLSEFIMDYEHIDLDEAHVLRQHQRIRRGASETNQTMKIEFRAYDRLFDIALQRSDAMLAEGFQVELVTPTGTQHPSVDVFVHYRGHLRDLGPDHSEVRARLINGRLQGSIFARDTLFYFEPSSEHMRAAPASHVIYPATAVRMIPESAGNHSTHFCGINHPEIDGHTQHGGGSHNHARASENGAAGSRFQGRFQDYFEMHSEGGLASGGQRFRRAGANGNPLKNTCEMALVADHRVFGAQGSSLTVTSNTMISFLEDVSLIYRFTTFGDGVGIGITLNVKRIVVYQDAVSQGNPFGTSTSSSATFLDQLASLQWANVCLAHGFTRQTFSNGVLGLAYIGTICQAPGVLSGVGLRSQNTGISTSLSFGDNAPRTTQMLVMAHEIGHNFGMQHDNLCSSYCSANPSRCGGDGQTVTYGGAGGNFIMWPISVDGSLPNHFVFSDCSTASAGRRINTASGAGGFCFTNSGLGQICGNGIVQGTEPCDCGSTDEATCIANDPCCLTNCTLRAPAQCSDKSGPCCANCSMIGDNPGAPVTGSSVLCGAADPSRCYLPRYCIKNTSFLGKCPDVDFPFEKLYVPDGCLTSSSATSCVKILLENATYPYHSPDGTLCNGGANVCSYRGCTESICSIYNSTNFANGSLPSGGYVASSHLVTECVDAGSPCTVACTFSAGVCTTTSAYASTPHGIAMGVVGVFRAQGRSCRSGTGFCTSGGECVTQASDTPIGSLFSIDSSWFVDYWYVTLGITLFFALLPFLLRWSYGKRETKIRIRERASALGRSVMRTLGRKPGEPRKPDALPINLDGPARRAGTRAQGARVIALELEDQKKKNLVPDDAYYRLQTLFPTAKAAVLKHLIKISPHEEACVSRLLKLGYPMYLAPDYRAYAHAGRKAKRQARDAALVTKQPAIPRAGQPQPRPGQQVQARPGQQVQARPGQQAQVRPGQQFQARPGQQAQARPGPQPGRAQAPSRN